MVNEPSVFEPLKFYCSFYTVFVTFTTENKRDSNNMREIHRTVKEFTALYLPDNSETVNYLIFAVLIFRVFFFFL